MEIKLNLKFIKLKDHFNAFFVAKFPVIRKIEVVPKEVFSHDMGFFTVCEQAFRVGFPERLTGRAPPLKNGPSLRLIFSTMNKKKKLVKKNLFLFLEI